MQTRTALVSELRSRLEHNGAPRATMFVILALAGGAAFLSSVVALNAGLYSMSLRYAIAVLVGYATFLLLIRAWIALHRRGRTSDASLDALDALDGLSFPEMTVEQPPSSPALFAGGRSGSAGGGAGWADGTLPGRRTRIDSGTNEGSGIDLPDLDELNVVWLIVPAVLLAAGGVICLGYIVYAAPLLLAEVALDAALVSTVYRRLHKRDVGHWAGAVLRLTWLPAVGLTFFMAATGFILQLIVPEARSIGGVLRALAG